MSQPMFSSKTRRLSAAAFRDVLRRLDAIERRLAGRSADSTHSHSDLMRRWDILGKNDCAVELRMTPRCGARIRHVGGNSNKRDERRIGRHLRSIAACAPKVFDRWNLSRRSNSV